MSLQRKAGLPTPEQLVARQQLIDTGCDPRMLDLFSQALAQSIRAKPTLAAQRDDLDRFKKTIDAEIVRLESAAATIERLGQRKVHNGRTWS
jgi:hypothetical protein